MNDVPLFDDLSPPAGQAERIPITVPTREELLVDLQILSDAAASLAHGQDPRIFQFLSMVVVVCEQTRAFLGAREP